MNLNELTGLIISDFTIQPLADMLALAEDSPSVRTYVAPFNQVTRSIIDQSLEGWQANPNVLVVWTRPEAVISSFESVLRYRSVPMEQLLAEVDEFAELVKVAAKRVQFAFVPTWSLPYYERGWGLLDMQAPGVAFTLMQMNLRLIQALESTGNVFVLDTARWLQTVGARASDPKLWLMGKLAFAPQLLQQAAADIKAGLRGLAGKARKLVLVDLDDTLWGGVVGDVGIENLNLGGHNPVGEAFVEFQRELKALTNRGILLGIISKNEEVTALNAIAKHPEMVLRQEDLVGWRINWKDKAENIAELVEELNLGLDAVVFLDDHPAERARVQSALPQVLVPNLPEDKMHYPRALKELRCFDSPRLTKEDMARTNMYRAEGARQQSRQAVPSMDAWLESLGLVVEVEMLNETNLGRATQLLNKTNQMNLKTRRMSEAEFLRWGQEPQNQVFVFRVSDRFGEYGLTGVSSVSVNGERADVEDFVLSCRVMGRRVESTMLHVLAEYARKQDLKLLRAEYVRTERNKPCYEFFQSDSGFRAQAGDAEYVWQLQEPYAAPDFIELTFLNGAQA